MSDYDHPPSAKRKLLFYLIVFGCVWLVVDASCFFILRHIEKTHTLFYRFDLPTEAQVAQYYETRYHPEWGWDIDRSAKGVLGQRQHRDIEIKPRYYIKTFGNSFTYCTNVDDDETWQAYIEDNSPWDCLNFGTPGFGTDQAILKYEGSTVKSMYTILGIQDENISRCMTSNWLFYQKKFAPKPYFEVQNDTLHLTYPPQGLEALQMFASMDYVQAIARDDYWASYHKEKNFPDRNIWPSSITLIKHA
ncbi:MAG: hypothetical protein OEN01_13675, partial [Candidatus Krumholzibacteria bacterium]|nr:hypothetical protein [Candidatus Krumholzibacteria bacterium]